MSAPQRRAPPPPPLTALRAQYANNLPRLKALAEEIYDIWVAVSGPVARPEKGYKLTIPNRVTADGNEAHVLNNGNESLMLFSMFSQRFLEYASIVEAGAHTGLNIWGRYVARWKDTWPGIGPDWPEDKWRPTGSRCTRDAVALDAFTAYFIGMFADGVQVQQDSYCATYDATSGVLTGIEFVVATERMTDAEYAEMQDTMMEVIANAITARESTYTAVTEEMKEIRRTSVARYAESVGELMSQALNKPVDAQTRQRVADLVRAVSTQERPASSSEAYIEELD